MNVRKLAALAGGAVVLAAGIAQAQVPQYGNNITLEQAKKVAAAAEADAKKRGWPMAVAIVDNAGQLVHFHRADNTQTGSILIAQDKAVSAAMLRRPTKALQDAVGSGGAGVRYLVLRHGTPIEGGIPITIDGKIVGGIGVSGMAGDQDSEIAKIGADALK